MMMKILMLCLGIVIAASVLAEGQTDRSSITLTIGDARLDRETGFLLVTLKAAATQGRTVWLNTYDPEYDLRLDQGTWMPQGVTRWRHPFGPQDIKKLSETNVWTRGYFYKVTNQPPESVTTIQFRIKREETKDAAIQQWLTVVGAQKDQEKFTNLWHGVAETAEYQIQNKGASNQASDAIGVEATPQHQR